jgi:hypothetical protein
MRTSIMVAATLFFTLTASACSHRSPTTPSEPGSFVLSPGQATAYGSLSVRFIGVTADSRCPGDALCVQFAAGDATVLVETSSGGSPRRAELQINDPARRRVSHGGFVVELTQLSPYPFASRPPIAAGDYRATILIARE